MADRYSEPIAAAVLAAASAVLVYRARCWHYRPLELILNTDGCVRHYSITIDALRRMPASTVLDDETRVRDYDGGRPTRQLQFRTSMDATNLDVAVSFAPQRVRTPTLRAHSTPA